MRITQKKLWPLLLIALLIGCANAPVNPYGTPHDQLVEVDGCQQVSVDNLDITFRPAGSVGSVLALDLGDHKVPGLRFQIKFTLTLTTSQGISNAVQVAKDIRIYSYYHVGDSILEVWNSEGTQLLHRHRIYDLMEQKALENPTEWPNGYWQPNPDGWVVDSDNTEEDLPQKKDPQDHTDHGVFVDTSHAGSAVVTWGDQITQYVEDSNRVKLYDHFRVRIMCGNRELHSKLYCVKDMEGLLERNFNDAPVEINPGKYFDCQ